MGIYKKIGLSHETGLIDTAPLSDDSIVFICQNHSFYRVSITVVYLVVRLSLFFSAGGI